MRIRSTARTTIVASLLALAVLLPIAPPVVAQRAAADTAEPSTAVALFRQGERDFANRLA